MMRGALDSSRYAEALKRNPAEAAATFFTREAVEGVNVTASGPEDLRAVLDRYASTGIDVLDVHLAGPPETRAYAIESLAAARP